MTSRAKPSAADLDLDEDLFDFQSATAADAAEDDEDLEQVFAQFEEDEAARLTAEALEPGPPASRADELPEGEQLAGLIPDPPPAIPRQAKPAGPPVLGAPSAQELEAHRVTSAARPTPEPSVPTPSAAVPRPAAPAAPITNGWKTAVWLLIAVTSVNALVALVALRSTGELRRSVETVGSQVNQTASELLRAAPGGSAAGLAGEPPGAPNAQSHPTFELALEDIQRGEFTRARRRLYALLAIVDRLDPEVREEIEARANFLLARALHMQSVQRWEVAR